MKIFDCFMYFDEDVVLDLRLKYLNTYKISKQSDFTHTSMGNPVGSYYIQAEDNDTFLDMYSKAIKNKEIIHMTEKHKRLSPI